MLLWFAIIMAFALFAWAVETARASYPKWFKRSLKALAVVVVADLFLAGLFYIALKLLGVV